MSETRQDQAPSKRVFGIPRGWVILVFIICACALGLRALLDSRFGSTALVYLAVPYLVSVTLFRFMPRSQKRGAWGWYINHLRDSTIVMLATSAVLFEGFICVLMFMPVYYLGVTVGFLALLWKDRADAAGGGTPLSVYLVPAVVLGLSLEGAVPWTFTPRTQSVTQSVVLDAGVDDLKANMARPIAFDQGRPWFLSIFPLPHRVEAGTLATGDVHTLHFTYRRWFVTNVHDGEMRLRIEEVGDRHVRTRVIDNTSYLAGYLSIDGTEVRFDERPDGRTEVSLTVHYTRLLDPAWYFGPLQRAAVNQSARYLIDTVIARELTDA